MSRNPEILKTVRTILSEVVKNDAVMTMAETASLKDDIGLDSLSSLTFLVAIEEALAFTVNPATLDASDFDNIQSICNYIETQTAGLPL